MVAFLTRTVAPLAISAALAANGLAQTLVKDIDPSQVGIAFSSNPNNFCVINGIAYFAATESSVLYGGTGTELWRSDGTALGTWLVRDISPGNSSPEQLTDVGGLLLFTADDGVAGRELWISDGTAAGTQLAWDVLAGATGSNPSALTAVATSPPSLYFAATTSVGTELCVFTPGGGTQTFDIAAGAASSNPTWLTAVGTNVYLSASSSLYVANSSGASIVSGSAGLAPHDLCLSGGVLYFGATSSGGDELFKYDFSTVAQILDLLPGGSSTPTQFTDVGGTLFFTADGPQGRELWTTNGTAAGTVLVRDINPGAAASTPLDLVPFNGVLAFTADDGSHGRELWTSDGTTAGTAMVADIAAGATGSQPAGLLAAGLQLFLSADDGVAGRELWVSNGTGAGTTLVADVWAGNSSGISSGSQAIGAMVGTTLLFAASDSPHGCELWRTDGTTSGTALVYDIAPTALPGGVLFDSLTCAAAGALFFVADDGVHGQELWRTDGTAAGTCMVLDINTGSAGSIPSLLTSFNGLAWFWANDGQHGFELWTSDGTAAGTTLFAEFNGNPGGSSVSWFRPIVMGSDLYFGAFDGTLYYVMRTSGTVLGGNMVWHGSSLNLPGTCAFNGRIWFEGDGELWSSDGTLAGATMFDLAPGGAGSFPHDMCAVGSQMFFVADAGGGDELWATDGTLAGTRRVADINPGPASSHPAWLTNRAGDLVFVADDGTHGPEPWRSNGTAAGTTMIADLRPGAASSRPRDLVATNNGLVWFTADDGTSGREMWFTNGLVAVEPVDLLPGQGDGAVLGPVAVGSNGRIVYLGRDAVFGEELRVAGPTVAGPTLTRLVTDLCPGASGSHAKAIGSLGDDLYLAADDGTTGRELWRMPEALVRGGTAEPAGTGCPGTGGLVPSIMALNGSPDLGNASFTIAATSCLGHTFALLWISTGLARLDLGNGCTLYPSYPFDLEFLVVVDNGGLAMQTVPVPMNTALVGLHAYAQFAVLDPNGAYANTASASNSLNMIVGW